MSRGKKEDRQPLLRRDDSDKSEATILVEDLEVGKKSKIPESIFNIKSKIAASATSLKSLVIGGKS
jgi:hypothetical protein